MNSLKGNNLAEAEPLLSAVLSKDPDNTEVIGWLAIVSHELGQTERAISLWQRLLTFRIQPSLFLATLHNLLQVIVVKDGKEKAREVVSQYQIPDWPVERIPNDHVSGELIKFIDLLLDLGQTQSAERLLNGLLTSRPGHGGFLLTLGKAQMAANKPDVAWKTLCQAEAALQDKDHLPLLGALRECAFMRTDEEAARSIRSRACRRSPILVYPAHPSQRARVLILNGDPRLGANTTSESQLHACGNLPNQLPKRLGEDFLFASIFVTDEVSRAAGRDFAPDLIVNNHSNGEMLIAEGRLDEVAAYVDSFCVPVVNHPNGASLTTRDHSVELLEGIPGLLLPRTVRFDKTDYSLEQMIDKVEATLPYPLISRHVSFQVGEGMTKVEDRSGLIQALAYRTGREFLATEFVDTRCSHGLYRKIRAALVNGEIHVIRVDYSQDWNVHAPKTAELAAAMMANKTLTTEMERVCANPVAELGVQAMQVLKAIAERVPLDIFGVDFDVDKDGRVVFYEANASMLLLDPELFWQYPADAEGRLLAAIRAYLKFLVGLKESGA